MRNIETFCKKVVKKYLRLYLWKKFICFFKNFTPKNDCIFIETKLKSLMFPKILFLVIKSKIRKKLKKIGNKTTKIGLANVQFYETNYIEVERGIAYMNYQREVAILTDFWQKNSERSKNEEINRKKKPKIN